ncbi:MAG TPA: SAM-dependent methyltransferase [Steroidobacteraceae bacterium]
MAVSPITNVSDTARWVAVYRAWESARSDALFRDPYAQRLAGPRGEEIARLMPRQARSGWPLIARTRLIDDRVAEAIRDGCDCVVNLAAGLDARPYRLELPSALRWVEVDLAALSDEKERLLADARPRCRLVRIKADLTDDRARASALVEALGSARRALAISEGLLVYLADVQVRALSADLLAQPALYSWVLDLAAPELLRMMNRTMGPHLANAPMRFAPADGVAFFEALGWRVEQAEPLLQAAARFGRVPWFLRLFAKFPPPDPRRLGNARWSAVVTLLRA